MNRFRFGIQRFHRLREFFVNLIIDGYDPKVRIFSIEAALGRLVGMLKPVAPDNDRLREGGGDVAPVCSCALGLCGHQWPSAICIWQAGVGAAEREFADETRFASVTVGIDYWTGIEVITIDRDNVAALRGSLDDARRRDVGKTASQDEMVWIRDLYGGAGRFEIALPDQTGKKSR